MMAQQGKRVLLIGCDPKSDTTSLLFGGRATPTIIETSSKKKAAGEEVQIEHVCFKRDGVFAMELGGPEVGRGCGGRGIIHGFELLEKLGFHEWGFDHVLLDFLGDVVCGGFGLPIARDMCQKVIIVGSNDLQSLYVANNVCSAVEYFRKLGGNVGVAGMVINKDDGTGEAQAFCAEAGIPALSALPAQLWTLRSTGSACGAGTNGTLDVSPPVDAMVRAALANHTGRPRAPASLAKPPRLRAETFQHVHSYPNSTRAVGRASGRGPTPCWPVPEAVPPGAHVLGVTR